MDDVVAEEVGRTLGSLSLRCAEPRGAAGGDGGGGDELAKLVDVAR